MDIATFRANMTEFADETKYPDSVITFPMKMAEAFCSASVWGNLFEIGMSLATAHFLVIAQNNLSSPGSGTDLVNSQSAGDVSAGFDTGSTIEQGGGNWNMTNYGRQFYRMSRLVGGVALQINGNESLS